MNWVLAVIALAIQPWSGHDLSTATTAAVAKYRLEVSGKPNEVVRLQAAGLADGWLGAFCTPKVCSPQRVEAVLPASGHAIFQFELIRESDSAPTESGATITSSDGAKVDVPTAYRK